MLPRILIMCRDKLNWHCFVSLEQDVQGSGGIEEGGGGGGNKLYGRKRDQHHSLTELQRCQSQNDPV